MQARNTHRMVFAATLLLARHAFSMSSFAGNNIWLIRDPKFIEHAGSLVHLNEDSVVYDRSGGTGAHRHVLANLRNKQTLPKDIVEVRPRSTRRTTVGL